MHGRPVIKTPVPENTALLNSELLECGDCHMPSQFIITEIGNVTIAPSHPFPKIWGWCGRCDIGG